MAEGKVEVGDSVDEKLTEDPTAKWPKFSNGEYVPKYVTRILGIRICVLPSGEIKLYAPARMKDEIVWEEKYEGEIYGLMMRELE